MMVAWKKSSHSGAGGTGECIELARFADAIGIRDSKAPHTGHLALPLDAFAALVDAVKRDELHP
ncbi:DUF397 domain-containing protein [Spirillospora albida]|uniref:DUF397 domain-containing protein n=1 Tax=Spirillospora albida TaxID=58123 RepID=UPI0004C0FF32|nr:DUF397 domain-containing protein [Spirillospora albida]